MSTSTLPLARPPMYICIRTWNHESSMPSLLSSQIFLHISFTNEPQKYSVKLNTECNRVSLSEHYFVSLVPAICNHISCAQVHELHSRLFSGIYIYIYIIYIFIYIYIFIFIYIYLYLYIYIYYIYIYIYIYIWYSFWAKLLYIYNQSVWTIYISFRQLHA